MRTPVFIVGAPRSGTTLLRVLLNRHPELAICGETNFFHRIYERRAVFGDLADAGHRARAVDAYLATGSAQRLGMNLTALRERMLRDAVTCRDFFSSLIGAWADVCGKPCSGEKTPWHSLYVKTLIEWFPGCSIVHLVRDPRDAVSSLITMPWESRSVLAATRVWRRFNTGALEAANDSGYLLAKYEELVARPDEQLARICAHIGVRYAAEMKGPRDGENPAHWWSERAHGQITGARTGAWRNQLQPWQTEVIETIAGGLLDHFGYRRERLPASALTMNRAAMEATLEVGLQKFFRLPSILSRCLRPADPAAEERWRARATRMYGRLRLRRSGAGPALNGLSRE